MAVLPEPATGFGDTRTATADVADASRPSSARRAVVAVAALPAVALVAAAGSALPSRLPGHVLSVSPGGALGVVVAALLAVVAVGFGVLVYGAWAERAPRTTGSEPPPLDEQEPQRVIDWWSALLLPLLFACVVALGLALGWLFGHPGADEGGTGRPQVPTVRGPAPPPAAGGSEGVPVHWLVFAVLAGLGGVVAAALLVRDRRRRRREVGPRESDDVAAALDESLEDLEREPDPRAAVIKAYARMERSLAARGAGRRPPETPLEYLRRVLSAVQVSPAAVTRLTASFQRAKFSPHAVDDEMKREAIAAVRDVRDELLAQDTVETA